MTEPKVVHEYEAVGTKIRVTEEDGQHLRWMLIKGEWHLDPTGDAEELARLAARVQELEDSLEARRQERDDLKQRVDNCNKNAGREITRLRDDISFLLNLVPGWAKDVPVGLCPTLYGTGSSEGDLVVKQRVDAIRALKEKP